MTQDSNKFKQIVSILPDIKKVNIRGEPDYYGASYIVAKKLKLPYVPRSLAGWVHGWRIPELRYVEELTGGGSYNRYLVAFGKHELFLKERGIDAKAVGLPFVYVEDIVIVTDPVKRLKNTLLVMPPHSLSYTDHVWDEISYAKQISKLKSYFDIIVVCLHQSCIEKNIWVDAFRQFDIPYVVGAECYDRNSLLRMYKLFKSFEYMTTNTIGSHVVYAAYCGCKVSIYGKYAKYMESDYKNTPVYMRFPFLLKHNMQHMSEQDIIKSFPFIFSHPVDAIKRIDWAAGQLGGKNKVSYYELAGLLGWHPKDKIPYYAKKMYKKWCGIR